MKTTLIAAAIFSSVLLVSCGPATTNTNLNNVVTGSGVDLSGVPTQNVQGNPNSTVVLVEFSDLQCPACKSADPSVKSVLGEFGSRLRFEYRHFPLTSIHRNAQAAAYAAEAAARQGKFFEMKDKLFATQEEWSDTPETMQLFATYAKELGLDTDKFERDALSPEVKATVDRDVALANKIGVNSTPTFYLNGKRLQPKSFSEFSGLVREAVLNAKQ